MRQDLHDWLMVAVCTIGSILLWTLIVAGAWVVANWCVYGRAFR